MNSTYNNSSPSCSLTDRVYSPGYLFFKLLNATYLRVLIGPGILLNTLCLIVLSRPRLSNKSTTILFLRFLAIFDIMSITLKYIRAEMNYQSTEKAHQIVILIPSVCKILYILMNSSISIAMWIIVLMSLDKAVAVTYPLKSSIWITHRRAFYICCATIIILFCANLSFIKFSGIRETRYKRKYCGFSVDSLVVELLTASILPMGIITTANIVIAVVLRRVSRVSLDWRAMEDNVKRDSDVNIPRKNMPTPSTCNRSSASSTITTTDVVLATKRRTTAQVTRMLLAVTSALIICNIPNTILFVAAKFYDATQILNGRVCRAVSDRDIILYKFGFYSNIVQDMLSDLPHIFNFFLYCLAGKKFRSIFFNEARHFLLDLHLIKRKERRFTYATSVMNRDLTATTGLNSNRRRVPANIPLTKARQSVEVLCNGNSTNTFLTHQNKNLLKANYHRYSAQPSHTRSYSTAQ